jgi:hypothetical protein
MTNVFVVTDIVEALMRAYDEYDKVKKCAAITRDEYSLAIDAVRTADTGGGGGDAAAVAAAHARELQLSNKYRSVGKRVEYLQHQVNEKLAVLKREMDADASAAQQFAAALSAARLVERLKASSFNAPGSSERAFISRFSELVSSLPGAPVAGSQ